MSITYTPIAERMKKGDMFICKNCNLLLPKHLESDVVKEWCKRCRRED